MPAPALIFDAPLSGVFQPSRPLIIKATELAFDFDLAVVAATAHILWYPEYATLNPFDTVNTIWYREITEELLGNGDVRMAPSQRRFSTQGVDGDLTTGVYHFDVQLKRVHAFVRLQLQGTGCTAKVWAPFGEIPSAP
jgi:hypothetical protein